MLPFSSSNITTSLASTSFNYPTSTLSNSSCNFQSSPSIENTNWKLDESLESTNIDSPLLCSSYSNQSNMDYRSMVDLHGYRSILPDERCNEGLNLWKNDENESEYERDHEISLTSLR